MKTLILCTYVVLHSNVYSDELYENMSAASIVYALNLCELVEDAKQKDFFYGEIGENLYLYWYKTRVSRTIKIKKSNPVEMMLMHVYICSLDSSIKNGFNKIFEDPLKNMFSKGSLELSKYYKNNDVGKYKKDLNMYHEFLKNEYNIIQKYKEMNETNE